MDKINHINLLNKKITKCSYCSDLKVLNCNNYKKDTGYGPVIGDGDINNCDIMFIGQNPSHIRYSKNKAFYGGNGDRFKQILLNYNIEKNIYFTNVMRCSTPKNENPIFHNIYNCKNYLLKEIEIIKPKIIVPMGNVAKTWCNSYIKGQYIIIPIQHPNYILRFGQYKDLANRIKEIKSSLKLFLVI